MRLFSFLMLSLVYGYILICLQFCGIVFSRELMLVLIVGVKEAHQKIIKEWNIL